MASARASAHGKSMRAGLADQVPGIRLQRFFVNRSIGSKWRHHGRDNSVDYFWRLTFSDRMFGRFGIRKPILKRRNPTKQYRIAESSECCGIAGITKKLLAQPSAIC